MGDVSAMVELLLQAGASPEVRSLMTAIGAKNVAAALLLVAHVDVKEPYGAGPRGAAGRHPRASPGPPRRPLLEGPRVLALG